MRKNYAPWYIPDEKEAYSESTIRRYIRSRGNAYKPNTVTYTKEEVSNNRTHNCGKGLHAATFLGAISFGRQFMSQFKVVRVLVDPDDVVCVPLGALHSTEEQNRKIRCKKLYVLDEVKRKLP